MKKITLLWGAYFLIILSLFFYSYTQVDLSLTLSKASMYQTIEKGFQYIGYFNRPLSTELYCFILGLLFIFYLLFIYFAKKSYFDIKKFWVYILAIGILLTFSYNAFSYDLFNYIFAAKVIIHYHLNPYAFTALDFPKDPMLSFMHWTHSTYAYGPIALGITLPFYILGIGYFLPTFFLFKMLSTVCFLGTIYFLQKILHKVSPEREIVAIVLFALNPLVLIESLVSAHNDSIMMFFAIAGIYFVLKKRWVLAFAALCISALTKDVTILLLVPSAIYMISSVRKKHFMSESLFLWLCGLSMLAGFLYVCTKIEVQPWYSLWFLPFFFLLKLPRLLIALIIGFTVGLLLRYVPFLWQGDWNGIAPAMKLYVTAITPILFFLLELIRMTIFRYEKA